MKQIWDSIMSFKDNIGTSVEVSFWFFITVAAGYSILFFVGIGLGRLDVLINGYKGEKREARELRRKRKRREE